MNVVFETRRYTRYVVRDRDGEIIRQGRVYGLRRAVDLELVGAGKSTIRLDGGPVGQALGPFVLHPDVPAGTNVRLEVF